MFIKKWFFEKWSLNAYVDIQNIYNFQSETPAYLDVVKDDQGNILTDPNNPAAYQTRLIPTTAGTLLPSIGVMIDF